MSNESADSKPNETAAPSLVRREHSPDESTNILNALTSNDGTLTVTVTVNKSTAKWLAIITVVVMLAVAAFLGAALYAFSTWGREARLATNALDEKRLENRAAWRSLGVDAESLEDHDISTLLEEVRKKHPAKEPAK